MRDQWIRDSEGYVLIYNITARTSFDQVHVFLDQIKRVKDTQEEIPIVLVGNKCDLEERREVSTSEGQQFAKNGGLSFFEASAKTRYNVENCFFELVRKIRKQRKPVKQVKSSCSIL